MTTTLSTQKLVPLIDELSRNITEILTILREDAQSADPAIKNTESESKTKTTEKAPTSTSPEESLTGSSTENKPKIKIEEVRAVLAEKSQAGLTSQVKDLLTSFGSVKLSGIDPARYPELIEAAKALQ